MTIGSDVTYVTYDSPVVRSGAAICAGAGAIATIEAAIPGGTPFSIVPGLVALVIALVLWRFGSQVPRDVLFLLAPLGTVLIAVTLSTGGGSGEAVILYAWPVLWTASFYDTRRTALVVAVVAVAHGLAMAGWEFDRWFDMTVSAAGIAAAVRMLAVRNERLVGRLTAESRIDPLTGLLNRRGLAERSEAELARATREGHPLAVVVVDIDHFKRLNDTYGHAAGDRALVALSATLREQTRGSDIVARSGGEEFMLVLPGADAASALDFAERLRTVVADTQPLTISAGVAAASPPLDGRELAVAADRALYEAKRAGRNRVVRAGYCREARKK